jgi:hypothetical protein
VGRYFGGFIWVGTQYIWRGRVGGVHPAVRYNHSYFEANYLGTRRKHGQEYFPNVIGTEPGNGNPVVGLAEEHTYHWNAVAYATVTVRAGEVARRNRTAS